jgi:hypothetical protein
MKERISMIRMKYSILKKKMKENECGWSNHTGDIGIDLLVYG